MAVPLGDCRDNFDTEDSSQCVSVEHDRNTGLKIRGVPQKYNFLFAKIALYWKVEANTNLKLIKINYI